MHLIDLCTVEPYSPKKSKSERGSVTQEASKILPFHSTNLLLCQTNLSKYLMLLASSGFQYSVGNLGKSIFVYLYSLLVTNGRFPQNLIKSISRIANFPDLFRNCVFFQFKRKKTLLIAEYLLVLMQLKFSMVKTQLHLRWDSLRQQLMIRSET